MALLGLPGRGLLLREEEEVVVVGERGGGGVGGRFWKGRWMLMKAATAWTCGEDWAWCRK